MDADHYVDPTHLYYAGRITLDEASKRQLALARAERTRSASPEWNRILRVFAWVIFPVALVLSLLADRHRQ